MKTSNRVKAHTIYKKEDGTIVPGASTIAKMLDKSGALTYWAWNLGRQGIDYRKSRDESGTIGSLSHYRLMCGHRNEKPDMTEYAKDIIDKSDNCLVSYHAWAKVHKLEMILCEKELVSHKYDFGGTPDFYGKCDGVLELQDYRTGKRLYDDYWIQVAGYDILLEEHGYKIENYRLINIPRKDGEEFQEGVKKNLDLYKKIFLNLLEIYHIQKEIKNG
jgi:hypothetical protein